MQPTVLDGEWGTTHLWRDHQLLEWTQWKALAADPRCKVGIPKEQRDYLGRWQAGAQESNAYVMSAKQIVTTIQQDVNRAICEGHLGLTEGELIGELKQYGEERGVHQRDGRWFHVLLRMQDHRYGLRTSYPTLQMRLEDVELEEMVARWAQPVPLTEVKSSGSGGAQKEMPYWVSISRKTGFRRLHKKSCACGVHYWTVATYEELEHVPKTGIDAWCRICFKAELESREDEDSSSSGSSTSTEEDLSHQEPEG